MIEKLLAEHQLKPAAYIVVHPTSRWMFKGWNHAGFAEVFKQLTLAGYKLVITSGPDKKEIAYVEEILAKQHLRRCKFGRKIDFKGIRGADCKGFMFYRSGFGGHAHGCRFRHSLCSFVWPQ